MGTLNEGEATVEGYSAERLDLEVTNGRNAGMEKPEDNMDPRGLSVGGTKRVRRGVDDVVEEAASSLDLNARGRSVVITDTVYGLGDEGVEGFVVSHELTGLAFTRVDSRANDSSRVEHGASLEGSDGGHEFRDGEGLAWQESLTQDMIRDGKERAWGVRGKEGTIKGERGSVRVRKGCR